MGPSPGAISEQAADTAPQAGWSPLVQRVLVAFDGSTGAWAALRYGIAVATARNAPLTIAAVANDPSPWIFVWPLAMTYTRDALRRDTERDLARALAAARDEVPATISVSTALLRGRTAHALAELANSGRYDLVITGRNHGHRLRRRLGRNVIARLMARSDTSVLAVNPET